MLQRLKSLFSYVSKHELKFLIGAFIFFMVMNWFSYYLITIGFSNNSKYWLYLDHEHNFPTYFSSFLWFVIAFRLFTIYNKKLLAAITLYLGLDESLVLHDMINKPAKKFLYHVNKWLEKYTDDFKELSEFPYAWVFVGILVMIPILYIFWKDSRSLKNNLLFIGIVIFFIGAVGMELIGGRFVQFQTDIFNAGHENNFIYNIILAFEEGLEIAGLMVMTYSLKVNKSGQ